MLSDWVHPLQPAPGAHASLEPSVAVQLSQGTNFSFSLRLGSDSWIQRMSGQDVWRWWSYWDPREGAGVL